MTCPTGSSLHSPRLTGRVVMPATSPYRSAHSVSSRRGSAASPIGASRASSPAPKLRSQRLPPPVDVLLGAPASSDVLDDGVALRGERGEQHRHPGANVGALDDLATQR